MKNPTKLFMAGLVILILVSIVGCGSNSTTSNSSSNSASADKKADDKVFKWKMASIYNDPKAATKFNSLGLGQQKFAELVNERTKGRIVITPYYNSVLGDNLKLFQDIRRGNLEVYFGQPMAGADKRFGAWNLPYLFKDLDQVEKVAGDPNGALFKLSEQWLADHKLKLLAVGPGALRGLANSKHPVKKVSDLKDLKIRTYEDPIVSIFWNGICNAAPLPFSQVYSALQTKTIDGLEFQATSILGRKMDEITKYYTDIDWQWVAGANIIVSDKHWNELPDDLKKIVQQAAIDAMKYQGQLQKEDDKKALEELKKNGVEVVRLTPEERQEWIKYARSLSGKLKEAVGEQVYDAVLKSVESSKP